MHNFKRALTASAAFLLVTVLVYAIAAAPYFVLDGYYYQDDKVRDDLSGKIDTLICGASHGYRAFNPELLDERLGCFCYNLSAPMETMYDRTVLLKKELARNPVKTVYLELSFNAMARSRTAEGPEGDIYTLGRLGNPLERILFFFKAFRPSEYGKIFYDTLQRSQQALKMYVKGTRSAHDNKGYIGLEAKDTTLDADAVDSLRGTLSFDKTVYEDNLRALDECMELCRKKGVEVVMVMTPLCDYYVIGAGDMEDVHEWYAAYADEQGCEFYDFNLIKTRFTDYPSETAFYDYLHLSESGAETFTNSFADVLARRESGEDVSELFFASYSEASENLCGQYKTAYAD